MHRAADCARTSQARRRCARSSSTAVGAGARHIAISRRCGGRVCRWKRKAGARVVPRRRRLDRSGAIDIKRDELAALIAARRLAPALGAELDTLRSKLSGSDQLALAFDGWLETRVPSIDYCRHRATLHTLKQSICDRRVLQLHYRKPTGEETRRFVEPAFVRWEPSVEAFYVVGWCRMRDAVRTFAVHRIVAVKSTDEAFLTRRDAIDHISKAFRLWGRPKVGTRRAGVLCWIPHGRSASGAGVPANRSARPPTAVCGSRWTSRHPRSSSA